MPSIEELITARERAARAAEPAIPADLPVIACERLVRIFSVAGVETQALQGLDLVLRRGELTALIGASGSGKTTLLNILAALDLPTGGRAVVAG
nr:ATP-binding cassette domain-containing protein [Actinomycetota bacterium]